MPYPKLQEELPEGLARTQHLVGFIGVSESLDDNRFRLGGLVINGQERSIKKLFIWFTKIPSSVVGPKLSMC